MIADIYKRESQDLLRERREHLRNLRRRYIPKAQICIDTIDAELARRRELAEHIK